MEAQLTAPPDSLLLGNGRQADFFAGEIDRDVPAAAYLELEQRGEFTGARLHEQNPRLYQAIVKLAAMSLPVRAIADVLQVSVNTVQAVREREQLSVETEKERIGKRWRFVQELAVEGLIEDLANPETRKKISARDKAIIGGVAAEKSELLLGGATARLDYQARPPGPTHEDYLASLKNVTATVPAIGLEGGNPAPKELGDSERVTARLASEAAASSAAGVLPAPRTPADQPAAAHPEKPGS